MIRNKPFYGIEGEDPYTHVCTFNSLCNTFKIEGATNDVVKLRLFPFSLTSDTKKWVNSFIDNSITT